MKSRIVNSPLYRAIGPALRWIRKRRNPELLEGIEVLDVALDTQHRKLRVRRWNSEDRHAVEQCFTDLQYEIPAIAGVGTYREWVDGFYERAVAAGKRPLIVDCGANIGASVAWFSMRYPKARIIAVEPAPENFAVLQRNTAGLDVELIAGGIAGADGRAQFAERDQTSMGAYLLHDQDGDVPTFCMQSLLAAHTTPDDVPFVLKIDIEGGEADLFCGDMDTLRQFPVVIIEPHDWKFPGEGIINGFLRFHLSEPRDLAIQHENLVSLSQGRLCREDL